MYSFIGMQYPTTNKGEQSESVRPSRPNVRTFRTDMCGPFAAVCCGELARHLIQMIGVLLRGASAFPREYAKNGRKSKLRKVLKTTGL
uniref:Uncharacterized protein n=1 Tax=Steinernema glaseri TaxID=37863 RepID=A0A1I7YC52_9BILA